MLLDARADPNVGDKEGEYELPISIASRRGFAEIVRFLLSAGAKPVDAALTEAIYNGRLSVVQMLFDQRPSSCRIETCLMDGLVYAVKFGSVKLVDLLLRLEAEEFNVNLAKAARQYGNLEVEQFLIAHQTKQRSQRYSDRSIIQA